jgi:hypothetical protein
MTFGAYDPTGTVVPKAQPAHHDGMGLFRDLAKRSLGVHVSVVHGSVDDAIAAVPAPELRAGPDTPRPGTVQVRYAGWLVSDGEPQVAVGETWTPRLQLQRHEGGSPTDWHPVVEPDRSDGPTALELLTDAAQPAVYAFIGEVLAGDSSATGTWCAVEAGGVRFAVPGRRAGRLRGIGYFEHDTHMVEGDAVCAAVEQPVHVERIQAMRHVHTREAVGGVVMLIGYEAPVEVTSTHAEVTGSPGDHTFFIDVRPA